MRLPVLLACLVYAGLTDSLAQTHTFAPFVGTAYRLEVDDIPKGYGPHIEGLEVLTDLRLDSLAIPNTYDTEGYFPGIDRAAGFGMVLFSTLEVREAGCYQLGLSSDDGSILWLDSAVVVDNDGAHQSRLEIDTVQLSAGAHDAKLWYFNGYPTIYELSLSCERIATDSAACYPPGERPLVTLPSSTLFASDADTLTTGALLALDTLCHRLRTYEFDRLEVHGHTDDQGSERYNDDLSTRRAQAVLDFLDDCFGLGEVETAARGFGESRPIDSNSTATGRQANRRVEIVIQAE